VSKDELRARVAAHKRSFKVGDRVDALVYPDLEIEGVLVEVGEHDGQLQTEHGVFTVLLALARKIEIP
jgi:hypothetical protein